MFQQYFAKFVQKAKSVWVNTAKQYYPLTFDRSQCSARLEVWRLFVTINEMNVDS